MKISEIEKLAEKYELESKGAAGAFFMALPFISNLIRSTLIDTAKDMPTAIKDINTAFSNLDKEAADAWFDSMGAGTYKKYKPDFDSFRKETSELGTVYSDIITGKTTPENFIKLQNLINQVSQKGSSARAKLEEVKTWATKTVEVAEDIGMTLGMHNSVRKGQDAIDRLLTEISKVVPELERIKNEAEKQKETTPVKTDMVDPFAELSQVII